MSRQKQAVWEGGRIRWSTAGVPTYDIRKFVTHQDGSKVRHEFSTGCNTPDGARAVLAKWERDHSYRPGADEPEPPQKAVLLDEALQKEFLAYSRRPIPEGGKGNSKEWVYHQASQLRWWAAHFEGCDLRKVKLEQITPALDGSKSRQQKIAVIKALYTWLRTVKFLVQTHEDPTYGRLKVPQSSPAQWKKPKTFSRENFLKVRKHLLEHHRDALDVQAGTGWHVRELIRFVKAGVIEEPKGATKAIAAVLCSPYAKNGEPLRTGVNEAVKKAAERLLEHGKAHGGFHYKKYLRALKDVSAALQVERIMPGSARHSVATWAIDAGASLQAVSAFLVHKSERTSRKFYATHAVAAKVPTLTDSLPQTE
jgi:integrase